MNFEFVKFRVNRSIVVGSTARTYIRNSLVNSRNCDVMDRGEVLPAFCDDKLDHDVAAGLGDSHLLLLTCTSVVRNLA